MLCCKTNRCPWRHHSIRLARATGQVSGWQKLSAGKYDHHIECILIRYTAQWLQRNASSCNSLSLEFRFLQPRSVPVLFFLQATPITNIYEWIIQTASIFHPKEMALKCRKQVPEVPLLQILFYLPLPYFFAIIEKQREIFSQNSISKQPSTENC